MQANRDPAVLSNRQDPDAATGSSTPPRTPARTIPKQTSNPEAPGVHNGRILPVRQYKVGELCKLIDAANADTGAARASQGAVANALDTLSRKGTVTRTVDRPATFQLTPPPTD